MVNTVLTDKTGTLTRNVMEFFKASIGGVSYGAGVTEIERANAARRGAPLDEAADGPSPVREQYFNFWDERIMGGAWAGQPNPQLAREFFRMLALCHTVIPDGGLPRGLECAWASMQSAGARARACACVDKLPLNSRLHIGALLAGPADPKKIRYEAESPDEAALVVAAKVFGFFFFKRTNTTLVRFSPALASLHCLCCIDGLRRGAAGLACWVMTPTWPDFSTGRSCHVSTPLPNTVDAARVAARGRGGGGVRGAQHPGVQLHTQAHERHAARARQPHPAVLQGGRRSLDGGRHAQWI